MTKPHHKQSQKGLAGVIGFPIHHSLSPVIHREWARREGLTDARYNLIAVAPHKFPEKIQQLRDEGYRGVNVTMPLKEQALNIANHVSDTARLVGAANMLTFRDGDIYADNSDVAGFIGAMASATDGIDLPDHALILGAGGAAPAIAIALHTLGVAKLTITNRTRSRAEEMAKNLSAQNITVSVRDWDERASIQAGIVVNTTSLGMKGQPALDYKPDPQNGTVLVGDIVYAPLETPLLKNAKKAGLSIVDGLSMLLHQAVPGYQQWLGSTATVDPSLRTLLEKTLYNASASMIKIGLTGSIGMGKSTVAAMFADFGCAVWDADAAVHRLYQKGGKAVSSVGSAFPNAIIDGSVDRDQLAKTLQAEPQRIKELEQIVHPLVAEDREEFMARERASGTRICVLDIPLLFENKSEAAFDATIVVSADEKVQRERVLARPRMTEEKFETIISRQMPDREKRARADYIIPTDIEMEDTRARVGSVLASIVDEQRSKS